MKLKLALLLFFGLHFFLLSAQSIARVENIKIQSEKLQQEREILIYTPVDYDWRTSEYFNVMYVFDSQSREFFDYTSSIISFITGGSSNFIVVGITSPYNEELDYSRPNDFLPVLETKEAQSRFGRYSGNADNFLSYVSEEVIPYINANYRTVNHNVAIGHSLGASFILYSLLEKPNLFENYIAISPNLAYDNNRLSRALSKFDYSQIHQPTYLYLSHADEGTSYWHEWKPAREQTYVFFDSLKNEQITVKMDEFPDKSHWSTFPPSLNSGLEFYFDTIYDEQQKVLSEESYEVTIRVKVPHKDDTVLITGNQAALGDWNPEKIMMSKVSDLERSITLTLKSPAEFKFTRGNWDSEAEVTGTFGNIMIKPELSEFFEYEITTYFDR